MNTAETIHTHLEKVKDLQMAFKSPVMRTLAVRIAKRALDCGEVWPDEIDHSDIREEDRNCVGSVFRQLANIGIIQRGARWRRSEADGAKGRTIFVYELASYKLAWAFVCKNDVPANVTQGNLL